MTRGFEDKMGQFMHVGGIRQGFRTCWYSWVKGKVPVVLSG